MKKQNLLELPRPSRKNGAASTASVLELRQRHVMALPGPMYAEPIQIVSGRRQHVFDEKGRRYLDGFAGVATVSIGHSHPHYVRKVTEQIKDYLHTSSLYLHPSLGHYAGRLIGQVKAANPELEVCFFTNSGSEANELAALLAKNFTGSHEFIALRHSYHGRTLMAMALTGQSAWRHSLPYVSGVSHVMANYSYRRPPNLTTEQFTDLCVADLADTLRTATSGRIAAFYAEPINGVGGVIVPEPDYFPRAYELIKRHGGLFVADEVQTGVGRTGTKFLGIEHWGVKPDIVTMAKGMGNGYPIGAVITTREVASAMSGKLHYNTYGGGPVAMAAAGAVLDVLEKEKLAENAAKIGNGLIKKLANLSSRSPLIGEVRGKGLMIGVELVKDKKTKEPAPEAALKILDLAKDAGLLIGKGGMANNVLRIKPPLCLNAADADFIVEVLEDSIKRL